ncbi:MAG: cytochrome c3 family protein [Hydrogenovibrio sp.]|uniref:cytochrome c3 family protein n=1 Tax=Hydrogenovibrio sp. TaxID=2065821 RepID=UPI00286FFC7D|nr:cytochrome c3 family protein [Hydrogenovibrio sp.]MDR9499656.1 cytochrome c3 family protein [Hydrogenovibrio sp.]
MSKEIEGVRVPKSWLASIGFALLFVAYAQNTLAANVSNVANTKHNLSASGPGSVKAVSEDRICVFCHTPHGASVAPNAPLWNRELSDAAYTLYTSDSMQGTLEQPGGSSKLCLSCHDGAMALGSVNFADGALNPQFEMTGTDADGTLSSADADTGFTRNLGTNLANDHPISFTYDATLAGLDSELYDPATAEHIGNRVPGVSKPHVPLENDQVQCISCHDPHIIDDKFLRLNRTQEGTHPSDGTFDSTQDIVCLGCHNKSGWSTSAHSHSSVANEVYTDTAADMREFPRGMAVWQASCLNCHDPHTVPGAKILLREGTDSTATPKSAGNAAQEQTCYQCHDVNGGIDNALVGGTGNETPDIKTEFELPYTKPITNAQQGVTEEPHSIVDHNMTESATNLGDNRHSECTDCHNPHRIIKNRLFNADPAIPGDQATHTHNPPTGEMHTNIISGALAGSWGVEPVYGDTAFGSLPTSFDIKKGYAGPGASTAKSATHVTREYQICLKCHSSFAYGNNPPQNTGPSAGHNDVFQYTDQSMEFQPPLADKGEAPIGSSGPDANHRSWHPVIDNTGRTSAVRGSTFPGGLSEEAFLPPWGDDGVSRVGNQTMYCSDCHGRSVPFVDTDPSTHNVEPPPDGPWGPHGSENAFILKGNWDQSQLPEPSNGLCFRCHNINFYSPGVDVDTNNVPKSGFSCDDNCTGSGAGAGAGCSFGDWASQNLHIGHSSNLGRLRCTWCHVAVPHGWRNKALLADITNDPEAQAAGCGDGGTQPCNAAPYYQNAYLGGNVGGVIWKPSGQWGGEACGQTGGADWMGTVCGNPQ